MSSPHSTHGPPLSLLNAATLPALQYIFFDFVKKLFCQFPKHFKGVQTPTRHILGETSCCNKQNSQVSVVHPNKSLILNHTKYSESQQRALFCAVLQKSRLLPLGSSVLPYALGVSFIWQEDGKREHRGRCTRFAGARPGRGDYHECPPSTGRNLVTWSYPTPRDTGKSGVACYQEEKEFCEHIAGSATSICQGPAFSEPCA